MIGNDWDFILKDILKSDEFLKFMDNVKDRYSKSICYPKFENIFEALKLTSYKDVKVVILGQDPYHGEGEANGLSFSVQPGSRLQPSLRNMYKELFSDLGIPISSNGDLTNWANQGVLLLNAVLTVEKDKPASHKKLGWDKFTDDIIKKLNLKNEPVVFILWGMFAKSKKDYITNPIHLVIESPHPSPFSAARGFFGSKPFSKTNEFLEKNNIKKIDFTL